MLKWAFGYQAHTSGNWRELWVTITGNFTGNFLKALSGNPQLQIGVFADTALVIY